MRWGRQYRLLESGIEENVPRSRKKLSLYGGLTPQSVSTCPGRDRE